MNVNIDIDLLKWAIEEVESFESFLEQNRGSMYDGPDPAFEEKVNALRVLVGLPAHKANWTAGAAWKKPRVKA